MTIDNFFTKYNGRFVDYDGKFGFQCMDLVRAYIAEVLGQRPYDVIYPVGWAKEAFSKFNPKYLTKVVNGAYNYPQKGDIVVWKYYPLVTGIAGHIAICQSANSWNMVTFDQNYGNPKNCRFVKHNYRGVLGWMKPKI